MKFTSTLLIAITAIASINGLAINRRDPGHSHGEPDDAYAEGAPPPILPPPIIPPPMGGDLLGGMLGGDGGGYAALLGSLLGGVPGVAPGDMLSGIPVVGGLMSGLGLGI